MDDIVDIVVVDCRCGLGLALALAQTIKTKLAVAVIVCLLWHHRSLEEVRQNSNRFGIWRDALKSCATTRREIL